MTYLNANFPDELPRLRAIRNHETPLKNQVYADFMFLHTANRVAEAIGLTLSSSLTSVYIYPTDGQPHFKLTSVDLCKWLSNSYNNLYKISIQRTLFQKTSDKSLTFSRLKAAGEELIPEQQETFDLITFLLNSGEVGDPILPLLDVMRTNPMYGVIHQQLVSRMSRSSLLQRLQ